MDNTNKGYYDPRYYSMDKLTKVSLFNIKKSLTQFRKDYDIVEYPIDCFALLKKIVEAKKIKIGVQIVSGVSSAFEAAAVYLTEIDEYLIQLKNVPKDWKRYSSWRRCNFTLAHELGHIFCGHLLISKKFKSKEEKIRDDNEADEFAGQLLMPAELFLKSQFSKYEELAKEYLVSTQACYKRLNNLQRLDLISIPRKTTCPICGNGDITPVSEYCDICGHYLTNNDPKGVKLIEYPSPLANENHRVYLCPVCGNEEYSENAQYCRICGTPAFNFCSNVNDEFDDIWDCDHINLPNARYCECCGSFTVFQRIGLFKDWKEDRDNYIRAVTQY